ncbi:MAG: ribonuclease PH [Bacillota bacterium]|nr:ribonuclease PH [Bacillota bacterium]
MRVQDRKNEELRPVKITRNYLKYAEGSALIEMGNTKVICAASVEENVPHWMKGGQKGWVTAEYSLLPRSTHSRNTREAARGRISGRTYEIQRLIGRSLRAVVDLNALGERTVWLDCDVLQADGGTRTAAITGAFVALADAFDLLHREKKIEKFPLTDFVAAISVGLFKGDALLDLSYEEDSQADVDMNIVMTGSEELVEVQGTAEKKSFSRNELNNLIDLGVRGINMLFNIQKESLGDIAHKISRSGKKKLILATRNEGKKEELKKMLSSLPFKVYSLGDFPQLPEVEETGSTFTENAILKAETISHLTGEMVLADDSGLEVMHLGGRPGVYSARFAGDGATDEENNALLLELMQKAAPPERKARFVCVMALAVPGKETQTVEGICEGVLANVPRGSRGFGYDPLFFYEKEGKTFGELDIEAKSRISHRGRAMQKIRDLLKQY